VARQERDGALRGVGQGFHRPARNGDLAEGKSGALQLSAQRQDRATVVEELLVRAGRHVGVTHGP
jgi:hypothetical protein